MELLDETGEIINHVSSFDKLPLVTWLRRSSKVHSGNMDSVLTCYFLSGILFT